MRSPTSMLAVAAALALLVPAAAPTGDERATAKLRVSASVVHTVAVTVSADASGGALRIRTPDGEVVTTALATAAGPGVALERHHEDPRHVVVTVHADAPLARRR